jgi:energy-coupling factor transport system ATP-binding protein
VIIVSHSMEDMAVYCDDILVMAHSKLLLRGSRDEIFSDPNKLLNAGLDVPQITHLMRILRAQGIDVDEGIHTVDAAVEAIAALFEEKKL